METVKVSKIVKKTFIIKMKILLTLRRLLQFSGLVPFDCPHNLILNSVQNILTCTLGALFIVSMSVDAINMKTYVGSLEVLFLVAPACSIMSTHAFFMWQRPKLMKFIEDLENIVNSRAQIFPETGNIYAKANRKAEKLSKFVATFTLVAVSLFILHWTLCCTYTILFKNHSVNEMFLLIPMA